MSKSNPKPRVVAFTGSTRRPSKSRTLAQLIASAVEVQPPVDVEFYDVFDAGPGLGAAFTRKELTPEALHIVEAVEQADALIAITPVYKGSYTGLFKHLIDFVDLEALHNKPVVIGATGGGHRHALIVEHQLRPLFGFFSALTIPTAIYASEHEFANGTVENEGVLERIDLAAAQLALLLAAQRDRLNKVRSPSEGVIAHPEVLDDRLMSAASA
jgi:FMN reductase